MNAPCSFASEVRKAGVIADSPWDLVNRRQSYGPAIPLITEWLERAEGEVPASDRAKFREGLVRSLTVREARGVAGPALLREFRRREATPDYRWAVANALEVVAGRDELEEMLELACDQSFGAERQMIVLALGRMHDPRVVRALIKLLYDDDVAGHAAIALGKLKAGEARAALENSLDHPKPWVRKEARKALTKLAG